MNNELELNGFQELTEDESIAVNGGLGIASMWVNFARNITLNALGGTQAGLYSGALGAANPGGSVTYPYAANGLAIASNWVGFSSALTNQILTNVMRGLASFGL